MFILIINGDLNMINVQQLIIDTIKGKIYSSTKEEQAAARQVLAELKTKYVDIKGDITNEIQHKLLTKMSNDREKSIEIYKSANREDKWKIEEFELLVIKSLLAEVEKDMPKQLSEEEITNKINEIISNNTNVNIGIIMKNFKDLPVNKGLVAKIAKNMLK